MLKNIGPEELKNHSQNSENIDDSQSQEENGIEPLCSFDISLNNGQKATLIIKEDDNYEQKVNTFCEEYKISPQDRQVLLQKVKEELEMYSNVDNNNNDIKNDDNNKINNNINNKEFNNNERNEEPKDKIPNNRNLIMGNINYIPKEQKKLDHILNESESFSFSSSVSQSQNNLNNKKNEFINNNIQPINNDMKKINETTINNNINKNTFSQVPNSFINFSNNIPNQNAQKFYNVKDQKNKKNKYKKPSYTGPPLNYTNNQIIYNNTNYTTPNINTPLQNNNILLPNSANNNIKNTFTDYSFNPKKTKTIFRNSLLGQKIEFIDNNDLLNNNNNMKVMTPKTTFKYNNIIYPQTNTQPVIQPVRESIVYGYPSTTEFNIEQNQINNENNPINYTYENPNIINNNYINNDYQIKNNNDQPKTAKVIGSYKILDNNNFNNQNVLTEPNSVNINYENLDYNTYETIIKPPIVYDENAKTQMNDLNSLNYNTTNFETSNNPIIEYNNNYDIVNYSPNITNEKYESLNNPIIEYNNDIQIIENGNNIDNQNNYTNQNDFPIYENIQVTKVPLENNDNNNLLIVNNTNTQNFDYVNPSNEIHEYPDYTNINNTNMNLTNNDINENLVKNYNDKDDETKRNTIFISNVKKITDEDLVQNEYNDQNNNIGTSNENNQKNEEQKNDENNNNEDNSPQKNSILKNNRNNSITKENDINIKSTINSKVKKNNNNNLSIVKTQNIDIKVQEKIENENKKNDSLNNNQKKINNIQNENISNDVYIKKNLDSLNDKKPIYNSPKNKIISNNSNNIRTKIIKKPLNLNKIKENNNKNLTPIISPKNIIKDNNLPQKKIDEKESQINLIKDNNLNLSKNNSPLIKKPINKLNSNIINNNNNSIKDNSNSNIKENKKSTEKKKVEKSEEDSNQENINENSSESKIIIKEENTDREPNDNVKKQKRKITLPKDTDEYDYKENEQQYDNLSLDSKNNDNNVNNNRSDKKTKRKNDKCNSNNENINELNNIKNINNEIAKNIYNGTNNYQNKKIKKDLNINNINNKSNNAKTDSSLYNLSDNINVSSIKNEKFINFIDKDLGLNRPKYKRNINKEKSDSFPSPLSQNSKINTKTIYQKKEINNNNKIIAQKKPIMKVLTIRNKNINDSNINNNYYINDKRSNSSGTRTNKTTKYNSNNNINYPGKRLYNNFMKKLPKSKEKMQKILNERLAKENKELLLKPQIDANSRRIIEKLRYYDNEKIKVEDRLINYGNNKRKKHLIEYANKDLINQEKNPFRPTINKISNELAEKNKQNRINETNNILKKKKNKYNFKKIDLEKEFGKRNRSIGNEHKNKNSFINFDDSKNNNLIEENNQNLSPLNKTSDLNKAYKELYNSIDEKMDSDLTKFFGVNGDLNSTEKKNNNLNQTRKNSNLKEIKNKNLFHDRPLTPNPYLKNYQKYNTFDYLYYESKNIGKKNKKKQELNFKRNYPFKPKISPLAKKMKNKKKESTNEFFDRISKNLEEIKIVNSKSQSNKNKSSEKNVKKNNNYNFRPKISRGPKNKNQRNITVDLEGFYDKRITKEKKELQDSKKEEEKEKKNLFNQKSKDIIIKMKLKKYKELFTLLDSDQDGLVSSNKIQLTKVNENVLKNISPILEELNQTKKEMNFKEFCIKLDKLMTEGKENNKENKK